MATKTLLIIIQDADWFFSHRLPAALEAKRRGYKVIVAVPLNAPDNRFNDEGFDVVVLSRNPLLLVHQIKKILDDVQPSVVHMFSLFYIALLGVLCRVMHVHSVVFTFAGLGFLFQRDGKRAKVLRWLTMPYLRYALGQGQIIVQNPDDAKTLLYHKLAKAKQMHLIKGSGVVLADYHYTPLPHTPIKTVLMASRLLKTKGVLEFCHAAYLIKKQDIQARFVLAGNYSKGHLDALKPKDLEPFLKAETIEYLGHVQDMPSLMREAYLVVLPSYYPEGVPKVLLEAAASARPIVTTDHQGCREVVDDGKQGLLVPIKDPESLAVAIKEMLLNPQQADAMARAARKRVEAEYDAKRIAERTCNVYDVYFKES